MHQRIDQHSNKAFERNGLSPGLMSRDSELLAATKVVADQSQSYTCFLCHVISGNLIKPALQRLDGKANDVCSLRQKKEARPLPVIMMIAAEEKQR
jgi:hypothetical protein